MMPIGLVVSEVLKKNKGLTQRTLAKQLKMSQPLLSQVVQLDQLAPAEILEEIGRMSDYPLELLLQSWYTEQFIRNLPRRVRENVLWWLTGHVKTGFVTFGRFRTGIAWIPNPAVELVLTSGQRSAAGADLNAALLGVALRPGTRLYRVFEVPGEADAWASRLPLGAVMAFIEEVRLSAPPAFILSSPQTPGGLLAYELQCEGNLRARPDLTDH